MYLALFILSVIGLASGFPNETPEEAGPINDIPDGGRIINGDIVNIKAYPHYVLIRNGPEICGGAIIKDDLVVTAARCVYRVLARYITVVAGLNSRNQKNPAIYKALRIVIHPRYARDNNYDIAVIKLREKIKLGPTVQIIALTDSSPAIKSTVRLVGYGYTACKRSDYGCRPSPSKNLRLSVRTVVKCSGTTLETTSKKSRTCIGDSGSPVSVGNKLVAVHKHGYPFCSGNSFHVNIANKRIKAFLINQMH